MNNTSWLAVIFTLGIVAAYEIWLAVAQRRTPQRLARSAHALLREDWFAAISAQPGSEILAVQTLRNSLMSATMAASTAVLGLMGSLSLTAPTLRDTLGQAATDSAAWPHVTPRLAMELVLLCLLFASLVASVMAVRYYNHASFIGGMPVGTPQRKRWATTGTAYVRKAGLLYSWGLRQLMLLVPIVAFVLHPVAGVAGALVVVAALVQFDRYRIESD
ncbi:MULTISPECIES: DUF599 domain-containing protein [unclassified Acidovorax]|uniref:DUF599 domain-containing protein n=1 Tax=unclassified Acidovorax TaxID=2684926 RepID=UPI000D3898DC|nr:MULTISPECIES: DUF599 domain-containing protein [unclassified Acidovorax]MBL7090575.1 DUF599 domain-containing protein [Acidovorax sp.]PTT33822.1 DUF599 domain-containing protein [Acidovorax sp. HMWF018]